MPSRGPTRGQVHNWNERHEVCNDNDSVCTVRSGPPDIEVLPCHCFPGEMCYDPCSIRKNSPPLSPKQCNTRMQAAADVYSAHGLSTKKFPGVKVLVGRNGLPFIVNPSSARHHQAESDNFSERESSLLYLAEQDFTTAPFAAPMSSSLPNSQPPILSLLSAREGSSVPIICYSSVNVANETSLQTSCSSYSSINSLSTTSLSEKMGNIATSQENVKEINEKNDTLQAEFNELVIKMNCDATYGNKNTSINASNPSQTLTPDKSSTNSASDSRRRDINPINHFQMATTTSISSVSHPSGTTASFLSVPGFMAPSPPPIQNARLSIDTSPTFTATSAEGLTVFTPSSSPSAPKHISLPFPSSVVPSTSEISIPTLPEVTAGALSLLVALPSPQASPGPRSPVRSSLDFPCRASQVGSLQTPSSSCPVSLVSSASSRVIPKRTSTCQQSVSHSVPPSRECHLSLKPRIQPFFEASSFNTNKPSAKSKEFRSSSEPAVGSVSSKKSDPPRAHKCQVLNLTDAVRQLNGELFEDDEPLDNVWIEGRS